MPWFKVDDDLHASMKAKRAGEAMALWVLAGSWCANQLTDGFVPEDVCRSLMPRRWRKMAATLVEVGLWVPAVARTELSANLNLPASNPEAGSPPNGYVFHDWEDYQPSRESILRDRQHAADRQKRARERAAAKREADHSHAVSHALRHGVSHGPPDPTRPSNPPVPDLGVDPEEDFNRAFSIAHTASAQGPAREIVMTLGANPSEADALIARIENQMKPRNLGGLVNSLARNGRLAEMLTEHRAAIVKANRSETIRRLRQKGPCAHGQPGGDQLHPDSQRPLCLACRQAENRLRKAQ